MAARRGAGVFSEAELPWETPGIKEQLSEVTASGSEQFWLRDRTSHVSPRGSADWKKTAGDQGVGPTKRTSGRVSHSLPLAWVA